MQWQRSGHDQHNSEGHDMSDAMSKMVQAVMAEMDTWHIETDEWHSNLNRSDQHGIELVIEAALAAAPTLEERRTVRLDNEGVEWFACDPYPTWYRRVDGEVLTLTSLGDEFCGWPAAPAVTDDVMAAIRARHDQDDIRHSCVADSEGQSCCFDDPEVVAKLLAAARTRGHNMTNYSTVYMMVGDREECLYLRIDGMPDNVKEALEWLAVLFVSVTFEISELPEGWATYERHHWDDLTKKGDTP
jgi:hypothetical protein